jgi:hypothetical protein
MLYSDRIPKSLAPEKLLFFDAKAAPDLEQRLHYARGILLMKPHNSTASRSANSVLICIASTIRIIRSKYD